MTPILPTSEHYLINLLAMQSAEAKRLWRKAIKEANNYECIIVDKGIENMILPLTMYIPDLWEVLILLGTVFPLVANVIRIKEVNSG